MSLFFLSYARADAKDDPYFEAFWTDLVKDVLLLKGPTSQPVGFRDTEGIGLGERWRPALAEALNDCTVFVPLLSESLFFSHACGKEWSFFDRRLKEWAKANPKDSIPPLILPILWAPLLSPRAIVDDIQNVTAPLGAEYEKEGLQLLTRLRKTTYEEQYAKFVRKFAQLIVTTTSKFDLPRLTPRPSFESVVSIFHESSATNGSASASAGIANGRPDHVHFVIVSGTADELRGVRELVDEYGNGWMDWKPYVPEAQRIAWLAQSVASADMFTSDLLPPDTDLGPVVEKAWRDGDIVVLIVDPWTIRIAEYRDRMREHDKRSVISQVILVPWNEADKETIRHANDLKDALVATFPSHTAGETENVVCRSIPMFKAQLSSALAEMQARVFTTREAVRRAEGRRIALPAIDATRSLV